MGLTADPLQSVLKSGRPSTKCLLNLLPLCLRSCVGVVSRHAEPIAIGRLVAKCLLADERIHVGVLEKRGKRVAP